MSRNRLVYILVALALLVTGGFTYNAAIDTTGVMSQVRAATNWIEENQSALNPADASLGNAPVASPDPYMSPDNFIVVPNEQPAVGTTGADLSDYFQRHRDSFNPADASLGTAPQSSPDSYLSPDAIDWLVRHPEMLDAADWFRRHPEWVNAANAVDLSDYFQRHPTVMTLSDTTGATDYFQRHPDSLKLGNVMDLSDWFQRHPELTTH